jgi:hypothetical protein
VSNFQKEYQGIWGESNGKNLIGKDFIQAELQFLSTQTWDPAKRLTWNSGDSLYPSVVVDQWHNVYVFWEDSTSGSYEIYYRRGEGHNYFSFLK